MQELVVLISFIPVFCDLMLMYVGPVRFSIDYIRRLRSCCVDFGAFFKICYL